MVTILLGTNDSSGEKEQAHIPLSLYEKNIEAMFHQIKKVKKDATVFLVTPPPINEPLWNKTEVEKYKASRSTKSNYSLKRYAAAIRCLGKRLKTPVIDPWTFMNYNDAGLYFDGLHFAKKGNTLFAEYWLKAINHTVLSYAPELLKDSVKPWNELKKINSTESNQSKCNKI